MRRKVRVVDHIASACAEMSAAAARSRGSEHDFSDAQASDAHTSVAPARTGGAAERPGPPYGVLRTRRRYALRAHPRTNRTHLWRPRTDRTLLSAPYERFCVAVSFEKRSSRPRRAEVFRSAICDCLSLNVSVSRRGGPHKRGVSPRGVSPPRKRVRLPPLLGLPYTSPYCSPSRSSPRRVSDALNNFTSEALCALRRPHPRPPQLHRRGGRGAARGARSVPVPTLPVPPPHESAAAAVFFPGLCSSVFCSSDGVLGG